MGRLAVSTKMATKLVVESNTEQGRMSNSLLRSFASMYRLTSREAEVLELLALSGARQDKIAKTLFIEVKTLKNHIFNIRDKTCCGSTVELLSKIITFMLEQEAKKEVDHAFV